MKMKPACLNLKKSNEPIRPVFDAMVGSSVLFRKKRGLNEATVMSTNLKICPVLVLSLGDTLPPDGNAKRLRVINKLKYYSFGMFRHVT